MVDVEYNKKLFLGYISLLLGIVGIISVISGYRNLFLVTDYHIIFISFVSVTGIILAMFQGVKQSHITVFLGLITNIIVIFFGIILSFLTSEIFIPLLFLLSLFLYFIPSIIAFIFKKKNLLAILLLNIFLGWTLIGWVAALIWSVIKDTKK